MENEFKEFAKIARLSRNCIVTEKLDGTNAQVTITEDGQFLTGSRSKWISPEDDNYGFARWTLANKEELMKLGVGTHYGEWWGLGIQRGYAMKEKIFSLFNTSRWSDASVRPACCSVVPILYKGIFDTQKIEECVVKLREEGSMASPGFKAEGVVVFHQQGNLLFKKTCEKDEEHKFQQK